MNKTLDASKANMKNRSGYPASLVMKYVIIAIAMISSIAPSRFSPVLLKLFGGLLILGLMQCINSRYRLATEVKLYFIFLGWAVFSGLFVSLDYGLSIRIAWTVLQMGLVFFAATLAHQWNPDLKLTFGGIWTIAVLYCLTAFTKEMGGSVSIYEVGRLSIQGQNPNLAGQVFVFGSFAALYLSEKTKSVKIKTLMLLSIPVFSVFLLFTGSRKMFIGQVILFFLWAVTSVIGREKKRLTASKLVLLIAILIAVVFAINTWKDTPMGHRFSALQDERDKSVEIRSSLYESGWNLYKRNPVAGVGLMNQTLLMESQVHSDFLDVLVSTGTVGAILYFSIYFVIVKRLWRERFFDYYYNSVDRRYFIVYLGTIFWLMFGYARYSDLLHLVVMGSFVGTFIKKDMLYRRVK